MVIDGKKRFRDAFPITTEPQKIFVLYKMANFTEK